MCIRDRRYCDERERKREIEIFEINRGYEMLVQSLDIQIGEKIDLPCEIEMDDYFDDTVVNDENLPDVVMDIVEEYADRMYLMLNNNTDGDRTKITNVDGLYELMGDKYVVNYYVNIINESDHYSNNCNVCR